MGAFSIAFDIIIVGALALPWVILVIHLFFSHNESTLKNLSGWVKDQQQPALAGILLFAIAFPLGSVMSRIAQDFFDDDDLHLLVFHHLLRVGVTEKSIRTDVFCNTFKPEPAATNSAIPPTQKPEPLKGSDPRSEDAFTKNCQSSTTEDSHLTNPSTEKHESLNAAPEIRDLLVAKSEQFKSTDPNCTYTGRWVIRACDQNTHQYITAEWISDQQNRAGDVFRVHEASVLLKGTDATERIRQFHDQIMVLRGAAFNGMLLFSLCLFWWVSKFQSRWRWAVLFFYVFPGAVAWVNHLRDHAHDPPYMEFTFLSLAAAGGWLLWQRRPKTDEAHEEPGAQNGPSHNGRGEIRFIYLFLAAFLTFTAFLGWWATQVLYDQQVIYSYKALSETPPSTTPATSHSGAPR
jgi:hypothetical protein